MNKELAGFQKKYLRGLAHNLNPIVFIGQNGVTDAVIRSMDEALSAHELIKVKFVDHKEKRTKGRLAAELGEKTGGSLVGMIGHVAVFFRPRPDPRKRRITLPQK